MKVSDIKINQKIYIELVNKDTREYLPSRIEEINARFFAIAMPMRKGALLPLQPGERVHIRFIHKTSCYGFTSIVAGRKRDPIPLLIIGRPEKVTAAEQRRSHVRVTATLPLRIYILEDNSARSMEASTVNLSAGGILLASETLLEVGREMVVELKLPDREPVVCKAKAVRTYMENAQDGVRGRMAVQFENIEEKMRDHIARFVFTKQREYIQKGLVEG